MQFRNYLYDIEHKAIFDFDNLIISVGNLSVGGTGKTPMVEYLIRFFLKKHPDLALTTLSRGYGRKSKGFMLADAEANAESDYEVVKHFNFPDHHQFTEKEIDEVNAFATDNHADVICTEKDWVRIISDKQLENVLGDKLFYLPMMVQFLEGEEALEKQLKGLINNQDKTTNYTSQ
jgi:tetraacyldisaccharide-1-P 4'-kinase